VPESTPMPPELAMEEPLLPDWKLAQLADEICATADDAGADIEAIARMVVGDGDLVLADHGQAEYAARVLARAAAELEALRNQAEEFVWRINDCYERQMRPLRARAAWAEALLEAWALAQREASGGRKATFEVPSARVTTRKASQRAAVVDAAAVEQALAELMESQLYDAIVTNVPKVYAADLRQHTEIGELVRAVLRCGHDTPARLGWDVSAGEVLACEKCGSDAEPVVDVVGEPVVCVRAGKRLLQLPGTVVEPESVSASVKVV
jgi:hypothetical protein